MELLLLQYYLLQVLFITVLLGFEKLLLTGPLVATRPRLHGASLFIFLFGEVRPGRAPPLPTLSPKVDPSSFLVPSTSLLLLDLWGDCSELLTPEQVQSGQVELVEEPMDWG